MLSFKQYLIELNQSSQMQRFEGEDYNPKSDIARQMEKSKELVIADQYKRANEILKSMDSDTRAYYLNKNSVDAVLKYPEDKKKHEQERNADDMRRITALAGIYSDVESKISGHVGTWPGWIKGDVALSQSADADRRFNLEKEKSWNTDLGLMLNYEGNPKDENIVMSPQGREAVRRREKEGRSVAFEPYDFKKQTEKTRSMLKDSPSNAVEFTGDVLKTIVSPFKSFVDTSGQAAKGMSPPTFQKKNQ
jgi:hypothetical protein